MRRIAGLFMLGLAALLPVGLLVYGSIALVVWAEGLFGGLVVRLLPEGIYLPGMGLAVAAALVLLTGLLARSWIGPRVGRWLSERLGRLPWLGRVYLALRRVARRLSHGSGAGYERVVLVADGRGGGRLGLVADRQGMDLGEPGRELVPVYLPAPFQPGGDLELLPPERLEPLAMGVDEAMSLVLSGGLANEYGSSSHEHDRS